MTDTITQDWTPCMKLPVVVHVRKQRPGETHVSTREGITPVKPDDLIMRGVSGEEYPIGKEIFEKTYTLDVDAPAAQPAQQEPVAWIDPKHLDWLAQSQDNQTGAGLSARKRFDGMVPLYTAPQEREPLTDEQIGDLAVKSWPNLPEHWFKDSVRWTSAWKSVSGFARAVELAHGIGSKT